MKNKETLSNAIKVFEKEQNKILNEFDKNKNTSDSYINGVMLSPDHIIVNMRGQAGQLIFNTVQTVIDMQYSQGMNETDQKDEIAKMVLKMLMKKYE